MFQGQISSNKWLFTYQLKYLFSLMGCPSFIFPHRKSKLQAQSSSHTGSPSFKLKVLPTQEVQALSSKFFPQRVVQVFNSKIFTQRVVQALGSKFLPHRVVQALGFKLKDLPTKINFNLGCQRLNLD